MPGRHETIHAPGQHGFPTGPPLQSLTKCSRKSNRDLERPLVAGLASLDPNFPMHLWCGIIHQCTQTLNLMRPSRINPHLSAEAQLNGAFHYNKSPLAPPGTKVLNHETPNKRRTWVVHGTDDWYFGGAPEHYRCYQVYATKPRAECIAQTVEFFPHNGKMPQLSSAEAAIRAAIDLCWVIQNPAPTSPPSALGNKQMQAIQQLVDVFATMTPKHGELASPLRVQPYQLSISDVQHQQIP
jgi:hypothetical protein